MTDYEKKQPTADCIVARLASNWDSRVSLLFKATDPYEHYCDENGEEVPCGAIVSWTDVELPPEESEDERIKKTAIKILKGVANRVFEYEGVSKESVLAYLEKQKKREYQLYEGTKDKFYKEGVKDGILIGKEEALKQKPAECIEFDNEFDNQVSHLLASVLKGEHEYNEDFAKYAAQSLLGYAKNELKPTEWSDNFEENIRNLLREKLKWTNDDGSISSTVLIDDKTLRDIISGIWFYVGKEALKYPDKQLNVEQKQVEIAPNQFDGITYGMQGYSTDKPSEWSEDDKTNGWTGVDLERYLSCLRRLGTGNPQQPETINSKWFKEHCRPQPQWKPSEEQMEALMLAIEGKWDAIKPTGYMSRRLEDLYEGLANTFGVECNLEK